MWTPASRAAKIASLERLLENTEASLGKFDAKFRDLAEWEVEAKGEWGKALWKDEERRITAEQIELQRIAAMLRQSLTFQREMLQRGRR